MSRFFIAFCALLVLSTCSSGKPPPRNLDNACALAAERPHYLRAMKTAESRWGVPVAVQMATIYQESKFVSNAKTPHKRFLGLPMGRVSSAKGYAQALDGTWDEYRQRTGKRLASRTNINDATDFMGWYMHGSSQQLGLAKTDARAQYLAYHEGRAGYRRGSYNAKAWLMRVAREVETRAVVYDRQLKSCTN